jgi:hypothetical protein
MKIVRALPYVVSVASLAVAGASWFYVLELDHREHISTRAFAAQAELDRIKRRDSDVNDLIRVCDMMSRRIRDANSLTIARLNHVEEAAIGGLLLLEQRINTLTRHVGQDLASLQSQIGTSQTTSPSSTRDALLRGFAEQMGRNMATPPSFSPTPSPYLDEYEREMARQRVNTVYGPRSR